MAWHEIEARATAESISARIVAMEAVQVYLLDAICSSPLSTQLAFQGGTCLRLVHGGYRYSEDLDLVTTTVADDALDALMTSTARGASDRLAAVLGAGDMRFDPPKAGPGARVRTWWFRYQRLGGREVLRVKIEVGRYPARDSHVSPLCREVLPFTPRPLVMACSARELMADKVNALAQRPYLKARDLFDLWFLADVLRVPLDPTLVRQKFVDYETATPLDALQRRRASLATCDLADELGRFLPRATRQMLESDGYLAVRAAARTILDRVLS